MQECINDTVTIHKFIDVDTLQIYFLLRKLEVTIVNAYNFINITLI